VKVRWGEGGYGMAGGCFTGVCYIVRKTTTRNMPQSHAGKRIMVNKVIPAWGAVNVRFHGVTNLYKSQII